ncbi:MAG TPA: GYD domain-containing protein [Anaerolineales bacterium]|nr:GYD domain-containing protein [Anaerolineales bacterium]
MATYFMFGKYSLEGMKGISAGRTKKTLDLIRKNGGEFKAGYALLGNVDLILILDMPDTGQAMKTSAALGKLLGASFSTAPAVSVEEFDTLMG